MDLSFVVDQGAMARVGPELRAHLRRMITSPRVLRSTSPGNEIPFYICPFAPEDQVRMSEECALLKVELEADSVPVLEINLYDLLIGTLRQFLDWDELANHERTETKDNLLQELQSTLQPSSPPTCWSSCLGSIAPPMTRTRSGPGSRP